METLALLVTGVGMIFGLSVHSTELVVINAVLFLVSILCTLFGENS